jgi:hypothetical protein
MRIKPLYALKHRRTGKLLGGSLEIDDRFMLKLKDPQIMTVSKGALIVFDSVKSAQKVLEKRNCKIRETEENPEIYIKEIVIVKLNIEPIKPDNIKG